MPSQGFVATVLRFSKMAESFLNRLPIRMCCRGLFLRTATIADFSDATPRSGKRVFNLTEQGRGCRHPGFYLRVVLLALPLHFFLMRPESVHTLSDLVAL